MTTVKILYLIDELHMPGGTEKQLFLLADSLPRDKFEPTIGVLYPSEYSLNLNLKTSIVNLKAVGSSTLRPFSTIRAICNLIAQKDIDIVQTQFNDSAIWGTLSAKIARTKPILIGTRRNLYHWIDEMPFTFQAYKFAARWADRIIVNSLTLRSMCSEIEEISADKVLFIPNGLDMQRFNNILPTETKKKLGFDSSHLIGVVANWRPVKGLTTFLRAAELVHQKIKSCHFVLAGQGSQKSELITLSRDLGLERHVSFIEDPTNVPEIIAALDVCVLPSNSESFSNVLIEYMAAGRAIVATKVGDAENIIDDNKNGILVPPGVPEEMSKAIISLISDKGKAMTMGRLAKGKVMANWDAKNISEQYQQLYLELFHQRNKP